LCNEYLRVDYFISRIERDKICSYHWF